MSDEVSERKRKDEELGGDCTVMEPAHIVVERLARGLVSHFFPSVSFFLSLYNSVVYHGVTCVPLFLPSPGHLFPCILHRLYKISVTKISHLMLLLPVI